MITSLKIKNYALIDALEVDFKTGLNIITGETGAGKSIIMEALELLLGERADSKILKNKDEKCVIEAEFSIADYKLQSFFQTNEIDYSDLSIIRREINQQGKSRAFINDTPVNLSLLRLLSELLVDIHSQHETLDIGKSLNQLEMLDYFAGIEPEVKSYHNDFLLYQSLQKEFSSLEEQEKKSKLDLDYFLFQYNELDEAKLVSGQFEEQEKELELLNNSENIKENLDAAVKILEDDSLGLINGLKNLKASIAKIAPYHESLKSIAERIESALIELRDIGTEITSVNDEVLYDPEKIQLLNDRINFISGLLHKHRVKSDIELIQIKDELQSKINAIDSLEEQLAVLAKRLEEQKQSLIKKATKISNARKKASPDFEKNIKEVLSQLAMPHAELTIELQSLNEPGAFGMDGIKFLFKTNKGGEFKELNKIASGGEFSRLMLALKSIIAKVKSLPTIIFDEIDTGVSGEVAHKMGTIMRQMGTSMQVFCITHLPQVASKGNAHYKVFKQVNKTATNTQMILLDQHQRIEEVAKMLSGEKLSDAALANAKELLAQNSK